MSDNERKFRSGGSTQAVSLDKTKKYKMDSTGSLVEVTTEGSDDIVFSGSKSSLRRIADLERNVSILAAKSLTTDSGNNEDIGVVEYARKAGKWYSARTITLGGDLSGSVSIDGSANVTLTATVAANSVALGTDTTGNYMANVTGSNGVSVSHTQGEGSSAALSLSGSYSGTWAVTGAITATGEVTAYASDSRLKTNVVAIESPLAKVEAIRGVTYEWNELGQSLGLGTAPQVGVIAQEIEAVLPQLVVESAHEGYKTVKYDKLTALLIESVKELSAKVKTLEARLGDQSL